MDELTLLRETRSETEGPTEAALAAARTALSRKWEAAPRHPARRRVLFVVAAATTVAAVVVIAGAVGISGPTVATAQAADVLREAALNSISASDPVVAPGQYLEVQTDAVVPTYSYPRDADSSTISNAVIYLSRSHEELYVPSDRSKDWTLVRTSAKPDAFFGKGAREIALKDWAEDGAAALAGERLHAREGEFYGGPWQPEDISAMPNDPQKLYAYLDRTYLGGSNSREEDMWVRLSDLLRQGLVPADLRATMYRTLALIPGVDITANQTTLNGRTGVAIGREEPGRGYRTDIIVDPATGQFIGEREVTTVAQNGVPVGTVWESTSVSTTVVDSAP